jgi:hypothetical protein
MFKKDSARFLQGVYRVETVTDSTHFTYLHFGPNTASGAQAIGVGTIMYKCDANIRIFGDGLISYDGALTGAGSLQTMGCIFNKVGNFYWNIRTEKSLKYGMYYANTWVATVGTPKASNPSNPIQGVGPIHDLHILPLYGESTDDPTALTTSNSGYTPYDLKDADGTKSSDGEVSRVEVDEICPSYVGTRCFLMFVDGAAGDITDVHFKRISNTATATATTGLSVGACLTLSGINIVGAAMRGIRIDHVTVGVPSPTNTQIPIQIGQSTDNAPFDFYGSIGRVEHVRLPGGAATDGSQCGLINVLGTAGGNGVQVCELDIGEVKAYVDTLGSSNIKVINFTPGGASTLKIGKIDVRQVNPVYTSSPTRGILAVFFDARTASKLIVDQMHLLGAMTAIQSDVLSDGHIIQIGRIFRDSGGQLIAGLLCHLGSVTATYGDIINIGGSYLLSNITAGKTVEIYINSLVSQGGARFLGIINAAGTLRLGIGKCDVTGAVAGTQTSLTIQLGGNIVGNQRGSTPLGIDVNLLDSTMANHLMGATVWNTNANPDATRQGMGFPAATAIGLYQVATTAGAAKFIRVGT